MFRIVPFAFLALYRPVLRADDAGGAGAAPGHGSTDDQILTDETPEES